VRVSHSARQALTAVLEMALAGGEPVTVAEVAARHAVPEAALAKVVQRLVRAGIAVGSRGVGGGYRLARDPSGITVADVIAVFETRPAARGPSRRGPVERRLRALFEEVDGTARSTLASVTLATLARGTGTRTGPGTRVTSPAGA
jgi:Rrf2 family protein